MVVFGTVVLLKIFFCFLSLEKKVGFRNRQMDSGFPKENSKQRKLMFL